MEKDKCKEKLKSAIIQRDKAAVTNMPLHGQFQTHLHSDHIDKKTSLLWLKDGRLKGHTESEVFAIQDQAVKTKYIEKHIYSTIEDDKCRLCNEYKETIHHITSGCPIYAQSLYLKENCNAKTS